MLPDNHTRMCSETTVRDKRMRRPPARFGDVADVDEAANVGGLSTAKPAQRRRPQAASEKTAQTQRCPHGRQRSKCKECGGGSVCEHGRERYRCKECGGRGVCKHGRQRSKCKECGGGGLCAHGRERFRCKECGGDGICEHGRERYYCRECGGGAFCEHGRERYHCRECGGGAFCAEHGVVRNRCKVCALVSGIFGLRDETCLDFGALMGLD